MASELWTCPDCGLPGPMAPDRLPGTEFTEEFLTALHQWARLFEHLNHDAWAEAHPGPPPTILDFVHWVLADHRQHSHNRPRNEPAGRPGAMRLEARSTAAA